MYIILATRYDNNKIIAGIIIRITRKAIIDVSITSETIFNMRSRDSAIILCWLKLAIKLWHIMDRVS